jgi:hypothetical protein
MNKFWKNLNVLASDHTLPPALVSIFKNALGDDSTSLKYLTFVLSPNGPGGQIDRDILEENFNMVDTARKYHLSLPEVQKAIQMFVERRAIPVREGAPTKEIGGLNGKNGNGHIPCAVLPFPVWIPVVVTEVRLWRWEKATPWFTGTRPRRKPRWPLPACGIFACLR